MVQFTIAEELCKSPDIDRLVCVREDVYHFAKEINLKTDKGM